MPPRLSPVTGRAIRHTIGRPRGQPLYRSHGYPFDRAAVNRSMLRYHFVIAGAVIEPLQGLPKGSFRDSPCSSASTAADHLLREELAPGETPIRARLGRVGITIRWA